MGHLRPDSSVLSGPWFALSGVRHGRLAALLLLLLRLRLRLLLLELLKQQELLHLPLELL